MSGSSILRLEADLRLEAEPGGAAADMQPDMQADMEAALQAAGVVGFWTHDVRADRFTLSEPLACLLGVAPESASLADLLAGARGQDRARVEAAIGDAVARGGALDVAFLTRSGARRIGLRGRIARDGEGRPMRGHGIALDLTDVEHAACEAGPEAERVTHRMAEHAIALRELAAGLRRPSLESAVDGLMIEIGMELARFLAAAESERLH